LREIIVVFCACVPLIAKQLKQVRKEGLCYGVKTSGFINFTFAKSDADVGTLAMICSIAGDQHLALATVELL